MFPTANWSQQDTQHQQWFVLSLLAPNERLLVCSVCDCQSTRMYLPTLHSTQCGLGATLFISRASGIYLSVECGKYTSSFHDPTTMSRSSTLHATHACVHTHSHKVQAGWTCVYKDISFGRPSALIWFYYLSEITAGFQRQKCYWIISRVRMQRIFYRCWKT